MIILKDIIMIVLTVVMYLAAKKLHKRFPSPFLNPALVASIGIIIVLLLFRQNYNSYMAGRHLINYLLSKQPYSSASN